ncbi:hypothetical protein IEQ34_014247 [Dendrobium chrysotoxum]|uniref:RRM domain-containing protein n=1 Tax=Dendrobium chrysotoxum TaxID=161865 RepID=A0AAV7GJF8_DENCH|nr:hypothetical protein IEQ34_014247 [Dendrobium chrysotoxum]
MDISSLVSLASLTSCGGILDKFSDCSWTRFLFTMMRPIFCGNVEYDARQSEIERLFSRYGRVDRVDMKSGFAFVYMEDERDAEDAIRGLDRREFGKQGRRLRVEWTKQERGGRRSVSSRRSSANSRPSKTLFVINFDPINTRTRDLERHFEPYGKLVNVRIRRNFAFIQFESQEDATKALEATNMRHIVAVGTPIWTRFACELKYSLRVTCELKYFLSNWYQSIVFGTIGG